MHEYRYTVIVKAGEKAEADRVIIERTGYDEEYGFDYTIEVENPGDLHPVSDEPGFCENCGLFFGQEGHGNEPCITDEMDEQNRMTAQAEAEANEALTDVTWRGTPSCEQCGGLVTLLGQLGSMTHWRCVSCGWDTAIAFRLLDPEVQEAVTDIESEQG